MSIVIALIIVLVVGALVANFYPKPNKTIVTAPEETKVETTPEPIVVVEPLVETKVVVEESKVETPKVEAPKMAAKPKKKKPQHKKPTKAKTNA